MSSILGQPLLQLAFLYSVLHVISRKKRFTDFEKGSIIGHVKDECGARRTAAYYRWSLSSLQFHVTRYKNTGGNCGE